MNREGEKSAKRRREEENVWYSPPIFASFAPSRFKAFPRFDKECAVAAYMVTEIEITDPERYEEYRKLVPASLEKICGGDDGRLPDRHVLKVGFMQRWMETGSLGKILGLDKRGARAL